MRALGRVMAVGAAYDLLFGLAIVFVPTPAARLLGIELPADPFYLRLDGVLLVILGAVCALPALRPERFHPIAPISAGGRTLGFALFVLAWREGRPIAFLLLGLADLVLGLVTFLAWLRARRATQVLDTTDS